MFMGYFLNDQQGPMDSFSLIAVMVNLDCKFKVCKAEIKLILLS